LDLRDIGSLDTLLAPLLDVSKPTLLVAECVFCYLPVEDSQAVIKWFWARFSRCAAVLYEMCGLE
jgi:[phosphatase 2A protein]-leucine-carboxy methyltransferase